VDCDRFESATKRAFVALGTEHGFDVQATRQGPGRCAVTYRGATSWVRISLDVQRDRYFQVEFGPLVGAEVLGALVFLPPEGEPLSHYPLWAVMRLHNVELPPFSFADGSVLDAELNAWADALESHAGDALHGDFSDYNGVRAILQANAAKKMAYAEKLVSRARAQRSQD
jgi:hypothetical protein